MFDHKKSAAAMEELINELGRLSGQMKQTHESTESREMAEGVEPESEDVEIGEDGLMHKDSPEVAAKEGHAPEAEEPESAVEISEEDQEYIRSKLNKPKKGLPMGFPRK